ncbi:hypothetical protein VM1G_10973 [Cytospora mali]|uniref:Uncharacterized protein n=1 Tax=Cytospora mali TaxID=578113 RepID=A0A194VJ57_CYTMA|nr:hypothetical protein VM1G_10973 [Valsa mali]
MATLLLDMTANQIVSPKHQVDFKQRLAPAMSQAARMLGVVSLKADTDRPNLTKNQTPWPRQPSPLLHTSLASTPEDADGGALREEFIPNWGNSEFTAFVDQLGGIIDRAVGETLSVVVGGDVKASLVERT